MSVAKKENTKTEATDNPAVVCNASGASSSTTWIEIKIDHSVERSRNRVRLGVGRRRKGKLRSPCPRWLWPCQSVVEESSTVVVAFKRQRLDSKFYVNVGVLSLRDNPLFLVLVRRISTGQKVFGLLQILVRNSRISTEIFWIIFLEISYAYFPPLVVCYKTSSMSNTSQCDIIKKKRGRLAKAEYYYLSITYVT